VTVLQGRRAQSDAMQYTLPLKQKQIEQTAAGTRRRRQGSDGATGRGAGAKPKVDRRLKRELERRKADERSRSGSRAAAGKKPGPPIRCILEGRGG